MDNLEPGHTQSRVPLRLGRDWDPEVGHPQVLIRTEEKTVENLGLNSFHEFLLVRV